MQALRILSSVLVIAGMALVAVTAAAAAAPPKATRCPILTASQWVLPYSPYTKGKQYDLTVHGKITCKQAAVYVRKLVTHRVKAFKVTGGPPGWVCTASPSKTGRAYTGQCSTSQIASLTSTGPGFVWTVG